jgi:succinate-acetate transporter protein
MTMIFNFTILALNILFAIICLKNYLKYNNSMDFVVGVINVVSAIIGMFNIAIRL